MRANNLTSNFQPPPQRSRSDEIDFSLARNVFPFITTNAKCRTSQNGQKHLWKLHGLFMTLSLRTHLFK